MIRAMIIRNATIDDHPAIAEITVEAYENGSHLDAGEDYRTTLADVASRAAEGDIIVAVDGDDVLGAVFLVRAGSSYSEIAGPGEVEFRMLAVAPRAQRRGI